MGTQAKSTWLVFVLVAACSAPADHRSTHEAPGELPASLRLPRASALPIRIGIEHLELGLGPERSPRSLSEQRSVSEMRTPARPSRAEHTIESRDQRENSERERRKRDGRTRLGFDPSQPVERALDRFLEEMTGYDQKHQPRSFDQIGIMNRIRSFALGGAAVWPDEKEREFEDRLIERWQGKLMGRPTAKALRELPVAHELEEGLEIFKSDHVPLSDQYHESHRSEPDFGRLSLRMRAGQTSDPLEVVYVWDGWRVGTSQENLKLGMTLPIAEDLALSLRGKYRYDAATWEFDSTLVWQIGRFQRANLLFSNHLDQLAEPTAFSASVTALENSNGVLFFFEYLF